MVRFYSIFLCLTFLLWSGESAKILVIFPVPAYSHFQLGFRIAKELADRGHEVTAINPYPQKTPIKNYKDISVEELVPYVEEMKKILFSMHSFNPLQSIQTVLQMGKEITEMTFKNKNVQELLNSNEKFDLVIMEHFINEALTGFAERFKAPLILIGSGGPSSINNYIVGNPSPSSYIPSTMGGFSKHMNFWQRTQNFLNNVLFDIMRELYLIPSQKKIFKKYIKTDLELDHVLYNVSLILLNSHVSVTDAVPHVPNMIDIGGYHINPTKKIPNDLQKFLDDAKEGVILFSMGSNLKSKDLKPEQREAILTAISKIKQKVLWKFEADLPNQPKNLKIMKWVPQQDVLAHPNVKAFISHGGLLSTIEAVYFGVPIIGIPVFGDQKMNIASATHNGYAVAVPLDELTEEKLSLALNEILNNPKYRENVKSRSRVMNDQPLKPIDSAIFWIEHVIRHKGAPYHRTAAVDLKWYQLHLIDIIIFLTVVTVVLFIIFYIIIKKILGLCFGKKQKVSKTKKNK